MNTEKMPVDSLSELNQLRAELAAERRELSRVLKECEAHCTEHREQLAAAQATIAECHEAITVGDIERRLLAAMRLGSANIDALHEALARECERLADASDADGEYSGYGIWLREEAAAHRAKKEVK